MTDISIHRTTTQFKEAVEAVRQLDRERFCEDEHLYANLKQHRLDEVKARADAEWLASDDRGRLPEGWTWEGRSNG